MQHQQEGRRVLDSVLEKLADAGKVERPPTMDGRKMTALIMPNKVVVRAKAKPAPKPAEGAKPVTAMGTEPPARRGSAAGGSAAV